MLRSLVTRSLLGATVVGAIAIPAATATSQATTPTVNVVGYSTVANAYSALESAFNATNVGHGVVFNNSFGGSTTQAENVLAGQPADVVNFSTQPDLQLLINGHLVSTTWYANPIDKAEGGMVTDSVVSIVVRPGNPLGIKGWNDLIKPGIHIVTPDPISSGGARWNLLEVYESQIQQGKTAAQAKAFTNALVGHVVTEPSSSSKALSSFLAGTGNVLLSYESDAFAAVAAHKPIKLVNPAQNILIQNPAALTSTGASKAAAVNFFKFMFSAAGQTIWMSQKFRPTLPALATAAKAHFYTPAKVITIHALGGWPAVTSKFFSTPNGIITKIEAAHGYTS
jgi:sulfate transport system substrate-binding protein